MSIMSWFASKSTTAKEEDVYFNAEADGYIAPNAIETGPHPDGDVYDPRQFPDNAPRPS